MKRFFKVFGIVVLITLIVGGIGGYFYWQSVKRTPQYSLALIVDAARRDDKEQIDKLVDTEAVVNNFIPQISEKAVELYGRNLPEGVVNQVAKIAAPLMPGIKQIARDELPRVIREKTEKFDKVPYWAIALFADRAIEVKIDGDLAHIKSKLPDKPVELTMKRDGDRWKVTGVKDEKLARKIAERVGQQIVALVSKGSLEEAKKALGLDNIGNMLKDLNDLFK